ncbi:MAG: extracellular solute-binding protein [Hyphomicrobiaceae bacterium]
MDRKAQISAQLRKGLSRREFSRMAAAAGLSMVTLPMLGGRAGAAANLTVFEWSGYEADNLHPEFVAKHGVPNFSIFAEEEEAYQKLKGGFKVDLTHPCTLSLRRWRDAGLIKPLDVSRIPRWKDIPEAMVQFKGMQYDGKIWMMPWDWGNSTIVYRDDEVKDNLDTYQMLLDEKLKGRVSIFDSADEVFCFAAAILGYKSHMDLSMEEIDKCGEVLRQLHKQVRFYWSDTTQLEQALASGEVAAAWCWTSTYTNLKGQGVPAKFMFPKEGLSSWMCGMVLNTDGPGDESLAYDYLDAMLDPTVGKVLIDEWGYGHSNGESYKLAESEIARDLGLLGDINKFLEGSRFQGEIEPDKREKMIALFDQIKLGG